MTGPRAYVIDVVSSCLAEICDEKGSAPWRREADLLVAHWLEKTGEDFTLGDAATTEMLAWWQDLRVMKNSDFPLGGAQ
jgi:hypothetical protein